jgi:hypothetical protein
MWKPQFPANPIAEIPAISIVDQTLQDISRWTPEGSGFGQRPKGALAAAIKH